MAKKQSGISELMIAPSQKKKNHDLLKSACFSGDDDVIDLADGDTGDLYLYVVSRRFKGLRPRQRIDLIWDIPMDRLTPAEWGQISLTEARTPDEPDPLANLK